MYCGIPAVLPQPHRRGATAAGVALTSPQRFRQLGEGKLVSSKVLSCTCRMNSMHTGIAHEQECFAVQHHLMPFAG